MFIKGSFGKIAYQVSGENKDRSIIFIHGFPFNRSMWDKQCEILTNDHLTVSFDIMGHGGSDVGSGQYLVEFIVDDLLSVMDHIGLAKSVLCGLSIGGYAALRAVDREPSRVSGLVLCNTKSTPDTNQAKLNRVNQIKTIVAGKKALFAEEQARALFAPESFETNKKAVEQDNRNNEINQRIDSHRHTHRTCRKDGYDREPGEDICPDAYRHG